MIAKDMKFGADLSRLTGRQVLRYSTLYSYLRHNRFFMRPLPLLSVGETEVENTIDWVGASEGQTGGCRTTVRAT
jgi:hypothetical protein